MYIYHFFPNKEKYPKIFSNASDDVSSEFEHENPGNLLKLETFAIKTKRFAYKIQVKQEKNLKKLKGNVKKHELT